MNVNKNGKNAIQLIPNYSICVSERKQNFSAFSSTMIHHFSGKFCEKFFYSLSSV
jgi:hypothetical protein